MYNKNVKQKIQEYFKKLFFFYAFPAFLASEILVHTKQTN